MAAYSRSEDLAGGGELPLGHPPELAHRLDQLSRDRAVVPRAFVSVVEAVAGLRQDLPEQTPQEVIEPVGGRGGPVVVDPDAQPLVASADGVGDAFVDPGGSGRERPQRATGRGLPGIEQRVGQHAGPDQVQAVDRVDQRVGEIGRRDRQPPRRMGQGRQRQQAARRRLLPQRPRRALRSHWHPEVVQAVDQRETERVGQVRRQHDDLPRR